MSLHGVNTHGQVRHDRKAPGKNRQKHRVRRSPFATPAHVGVLHSSTLHESSSSDFRPASSSAGAQQAYDHHSGRLEEGSSAYLEAQRSGSGNSSGGGEGHSPSGREKTNSGGNRSTDRTFCRLTALAAKEGSKKVPNRVLQKHLLRASQPRSWKKRDYVYNSLLPTTILVPQRYGSGTVPSASNQHSEQPSALLPQMPQSAGKLRAFSCCCRKPATVAHRCPKRTDTIGNSA